VMTPQPPARRSIITPRADRFPFIIERPPCGPTNERRFDGTSSTPFGPAPRPALQQSSVSHAARCDQLAALFVNGRARGRLTVSSEDKELACRPLKRLRTR